MRATPITKRYHAKLAFLLAIVAVALGFVWQGHLGFNLGDEGFLWYGAQRVMMNEVPIRDFMAYDPGRYYWSAATMIFLGDNGIIALRAAVAAFQVLGLFLGLLLIARSAPKVSPLYLVLAAVSLFIWMFPRHKLFDISLAIGLVWLLAYLLDSPSARRYFLTGLGVGVVAVFGRNHGAYGAIASIGILLWIALERDNNIGVLKAFIYWLAGVLAGYLPMMLMLVGVPGYAQAFWYSISFLFDVGTTNLPLPIPWPWTIPFGQFGWLDTFRGVMVGLLFLTLAVAGVVGLVWIFWLRLRKRTLAAPLVAAVVLIPPYAHFAYSRADIPHLAQGIFPLLIALLSIVATLPAATKWILTSMIAIASLLVMLPVHPGWQCLGRQECVTVDMAGDELLVEPDMAAKLAMLRRLADEYASGGRSFVVAPFWPGAYPFLQRKAPVWEIYALFPRGEELQHQEIARIKSAAPGFILLDDTALDGRKALKFSNTHPLIVRYATENYESISLELSGSPSKMLFLPRQSIK